MMNLFRSCIATLLLAGFAAAGTIDTLWSRSYDGPSRNQYNQAADMYVDEATGCVYVCGSGERDFAGQTDMLLVKYDAQGETLWARIVGGNTFSPDDMAQALAVDGEGNVYIAGLTNNASPRGYDITWAKYDADGTPLWIRKTGWADEDAVYDLLIGADGGVYMCGARPDGRTGLSAYLVMRINPDNGDTLWTRSFVFDTLADSKRGKPARDVHPEFFDDYDYWDNCATAMAWSPEGNLVVTGFGLDYNHEREWWTMKFTPEGDTLWARSYHHPNTLEPDDDVAFDLAVAATGDIYAVGFDYYETGSAYEGYNFAVVWYNSAGVFQGNRSNNIGIEDGDDYAFSVVLDDSTPQNVYATGVLAYPLPAGEQVVTYKLNPSLTNRWGASGATWGGNEDDRAFDVFHNAGRVYVAGFSGSDLFVHCYTTANPPIGQPKNPAWTYVHPSADNIEDYGAAVCATDSNHVYFAGQNGHSGPPNWTSQLAGRLFFADRDLELDSIIAPRATIAYLDTVTPRARVVNRGADPARFTVVMTIDGGYADTVAAAALAPGETTVVSFRRWTANSAGDLAVRCSVATTGDPNIANNVMERVVRVLVAGHDVGCDRVTAPRGSVSLGLGIVPTAILRNYGNVPETFRAVFRIGSSYVDTQSVTVAAGDSVLRSFRTWTASPRGSYAVSCSTILVSDTFTANDRAVDSVQVLLRDVGVTAIISPTGAIDSGVTITPRVYVRNLGDLPENFPVRFEIVGHYSDIRTVDNLEPGDSTVVEFLSWEPPARGRYYDECRTELPGDMNPENDRLADSFEIRVLDAGVAMIRAPSGVVDSGAQVVPRVEVVNFGTSEQTFPVWFRIHQDAPDRVASPSISLSPSLFAPSFLSPPTPLLPDQVYEDSVTVTLPPGEPTEVEFRTWIASPTGSFRLEAFTMLEGDANPANDTATGSVTVTGPAHDVGVTEIVSPQGEIDTGTPVVPTAIVTNFGSVQEVFRVRFQIDTLYSGDTSVTLEGGTSDTVRFATWIASPVGDFGTRCSTMLDGDSNPGNDMMLGRVIVLPGTGLASPAEPALPTAFLLDNGLPNPFHRRVAIRYALPRQSQVTLRIYSTSGSLVRTLVNGVRQPGFHRTNWDGRDELGRPAPTGMYICRLEAGEFQSDRKLVKTE